MRFVNIFYIAVFAIGAGLFYLFQINSTDELSFYGFAESNETEINYNYPVVVKNILVQPGQAVQKGEVLLELIRRKSKEVLADQDYKVDELRAQEGVWRQKKENDIEILRQKYKVSSSELTKKLSELRKELEYKKTLSSGLQSIKVSESKYKPIEEEIQQLELQLKNTRESFSINVENVEKELKKGVNPYGAQIKRLRAEKEFELAQIEQDILVRAPSDGLIGNITCKEEEHVPSYNTLLSFYEPHSGIIKGFIHEDLTHQVDIGDYYIVSSLKNESISYDAKVIGLGSRIVEIPSRLRKRSELKTYGREVLLEIPMDNIFLQKEKVSVYATSTK